MRVLLLAGLFALVATTSTARADDLLEGFEGFGDAALWRGADWAEATRDASGPHAITQGPFGASEGGHALQVSLTFSGQGYAQGYAGRSARLSLRDAAALAVDVTLPHGAPAGLRAKLVILVGPGARWVEPRASTALTPGQRVVVSLPLAGAVDAPPDRAELEQVVGYGLKLEGQGLRWSGVVALDRVRVVRDAGDVLGGGPVRSVGVFGGYVRGGKADVPRRNGYLTFVADADLGGHALRWPKLGPAGEDLRLGELRPGGAPLGQATQRFIDWTTLELRATRLGLTGRLEARALLSRAFPAVRYRTTGRTVEWATGLDGRARAARIAVVLDGRPTVHDLARGRLDLSRMSEPWLLVWAGPARGWGFDAPTLLTFERRPRRADPTSAGVELEFAGAASCVQVMPLFGLTRLPLTGTSWDAGLPAHVLHTCRAWVPRLAAFPTGCVETFAVRGERVTVTDTWRHEVIADAWGTRPTKVAPLPPVVVRAGACGYPVSYPGGAPTITDTATFFGPFAFVEGERSSYDLPAPAGARRLPVALRVEGEPAVAGVRPELERWLRDKTPQQPIPDFIDNNDRAAASLASAYATLDEPLRALARERAPRLVEFSWRADSLQTLTEPVTGQRYRNGAKYWCSNEPFDKEWYTGRQLASLALVAETFDLGLARAAWPEALGLFRYFRIFFDWATGSTLSSVYGVTALCDGVHFAWEGMLGMARLAEHLGDRATHDDAVYRAARQQAALFALWHQAQWAKDLDYAVGHLTHAKLAPAAVETVGGVDGFVEETGCTTLEMRSFWQTTNYVFFDNVPQPSFYRDHGLAPRVGRILDEVVPALHPRWREGDVLDPVDKKHYGSEFTAAHLIARALLRHEDPRPLFDVYMNNRTTAQSQRWYTMHRFGMAVPTLLAIERARAPVVEVPTALRVERAVWSAATGALALEVEARRDVDEAVRVLHPGAGPIEVPVRLREGERSTVRWPASTTRGLVGAVRGPP